MYTNLKIQVSLLTTKREKRCKNKWNIHSHLIFYIQLHSWPSYALHHKLHSSFTLALCNNIGLVLIFSMIYGLGIELHVYTCARIAGLRVDYDVICVCTRLGAYPVSSRGVFQFLPPAAILYSCLEQLSIYRNCYRRIVLNILHFQFAVLFSSCAITMAEGGNQEKEVRVLMCECDLQYY